MTSPAGSTGWPHAEEVLAGARAWSTGFAADEAAVELLAAVAVEVPQLWGPAPPGWEPWLRPCPRPACWYLDGPALAEAAVLFRQAVQPVLRLVASLVADGADLQLGVTLAAVPRPWLSTVFDALAHAAGLPALAAGGPVGRDPVAGRYGQVQGAYLVPVVPAIPAVPETAGIPGLGGGRCGGW